MSDLTPPESSNTSQVSQGLAPQTEHWSSDVGNKCFVGPLTVTPSGYFLVGWCGEQCYCDEMTQAGSHATLDQGTQFRPFMGKDTETQKNNFSRPLGNGEAKLKPEPRGPISQA